MKADTDLLSLSLDELNRLNPTSRWPIGDLVTAACLLEATAPKAGNVHPTASFHDMDYEDFRRSADVLGKVFGAFATASRNTNDLLNEAASIGRWVLEAVCETRRQVGKNTNLGIIMLLVPLTVSYTCDVMDRTSQAARSRAELHHRWQQALIKRLNELTSDDSQRFYEAIAIANPGGLGRVEHMDIHESPPNDLQTAMQTAAQWDDIAKQYATGFSDVFIIADRIHQLRYTRQLLWFETLARVHVERLASHGDTLIARKNGPSIVAEVRELAKVVLADGEIDLVAYDQLDSYLRADGNRRNPGTTADLLAAGVFICLIDVWEEGRLR